MRPTIRFITTAPTRTPVRSPKTCVPKSVVYALAAGATALSVAAVVVAIWNSWPSPSPARACDDVQSAMVDLSDKIDGPGRQRIGTRLDRIVADSCMGTRTLLSQFRPSAKEPAYLLLNAIDTGTSEERWMDTKRLVDQEREKRFSGPLRAQIERALIPDWRPQSFLIQGLSYHTRLPDFRGDDPGRRKQLVIISDMLHFSDACSMYPGERAKRASHWAYVRTACGRLAQDFPFRLKGTDIEILLIRRGRGKNGAELQPPELKEFWEDLFKSAGANNVVWVQL